jgi:hypothetical protein
MRDRLLAVTAIMLSAVALPLAAQRLPPLPYSASGVCPGECCMYREWVADKAIRVHRLRSARAPIVFTVAEGERVEALTGTVVTTRAGMVRVTADVVDVEYYRQLPPPRHSDRGTVHARRGEVFYLLTPKGEGFYTAWFRGRLLGDIEALPSSPFHADGRALGEGDGDREPVIVWWAKIRNLRGQVGWTSEADQFGNQDSCG